MRHILLIIALLYFPKFLSAQTVDKISAIRQNVQTINSESAYNIKILTNDYFADVKEEATDNGQNLTGYNKNGILRKMVYSLGLSYCMKTFEYYFADDGLIFVFEKEEDYAEKKDKHGQFIGLDNTKLIPGFEGRYYFDKGKIFKKTVKGQRKMANKDDDTSFLADMKGLINDLKTAKSK